MSPEAGSNTNQKQQNPKILLSKRSVSFHEVEVREYERCLGDHPATSYGPSLSIGWLYTALEKLSVDGYEKARPSPQRRTVGELQVPSTVREALLRQHTDCTKKDIATACNSIRQARHERQMSVALQEFEHYHLAWESIQKKMARLLKKKPSKQREQELLWEQAAANSSRPRSSSSTTNKTELVTRNLAPEDHHVASSSWQQPQEKEDSLSRDSEEEDIPVAVALISETKTQHHGPNKNQNNKAFVVVGEDGTTMIDPAHTTDSSVRTVGTDPMSGSFTSLDGRNQQQNGFDGGKLILVKKSMKEKKKLFGFGSGRRNTAPRMVPPVGSTDPSSCSPGVILEC